MSSLNRRTFLLSSATALAAAGGRTSRAASAAEEIRVGLIGCGIRGHSFASVASAVCDPDSTRLGKMAEAASVPSVNAVTDFRRILDDPSIDAVVIATPDHWHAPAAILACDAGKHVYVEKPCSHNFRESQLLMQAAKRNGVVVQHGTQQRSREFSRDAMAMLHEGTIGEVLMAKAWNIQQRGDIGNQKPSKPPAEVDYDTWVGPAAWLPYQSNRLHSDWHWWHNFGTGDIGNDGAHELDYARWGLGVDALPNRINATGGKYFFDDDQEFPDTANCTFEYAPSDAKSKPRQLMFEMRLWSRNYPYNCDSGVEYYGTKGKMFFSKRGKLQVVGENNQKLVDRRPGNEDSQAHVKNFLDTIRGRTKLNAPLIEAHRSVALAHLANISLQVGRSLTFDPAAEVIENDKQAQSMLTRAYRDGGHWAIPKNVGEV